MSRPYTFEMKKKIKEKIEKISEKKHLEKIRDIIFKFNPDINVSQNSSGMLLFFHNLTDETYNKIENYIGKMDKDKIKEITDSYNNDDIKIKINDKNINNNIRLSSVEKNLIKKKDYYEKLDKENNIDSDVIYTNIDDDIFLDKDTLTDNKLTKTVKNKK
jgi:hypothetical protein